MTPPPAASGKDADDMRALRCGDDSALDRLMDRWQTPLRAFLYRHTQDEFDSLDLAQETFVRVYRHRDRFRPETARFSTWLFSIALNLARDRARRLGRRPATALEEVSGRMIDDPAAHPRAQTEANERVCAVRAAIAALPDDLRAVVILFEYEAKSHAEIAAMLKATPKAVETRLYRARQLLRKRLARWL
ncbi:MAG: sigma-70 family RNA polymerase sigma factor [Opitutaceae bacterium]|jgi:RNA polymerase sigma-70 factor (ECF subfamily)|nr:sigma-70 family RNA polymerase sigma factor [Opitutaceae bacterium]